MTYSYYILCNPTPTLILVRVPIGERARTGFRSYHVLVPQRLIRRGVNQIMRSHGLRGTDCDLIMEFAHPDSPRSDQCLLGDALTKLYLTFEEPQRFPNNYREFWLYDWSLLGSCFELIRSPVPDPTEKPRERCQARESNNVQCELTAGHTGHHACPSSLARFRTARFYQPKAS